MSSPDAPPALRYGLIGCGDIGRLRAEALARMGGGRLVAAADADPARAADVARRFGGEAAAGWTELVARDDVDAVIVSTPPPLHAEMSIAALAAGRHVLCEKPLARTPGECAAMVEAAGSSGRFLGTGFNYRFYPSAARARELLESGVVGELDHVRAYAGYSATMHGQPWVHDAGVVGGGALRDNGIHLIDLTRWFLGEVAEVRGWATGRVWGFPGCEDNGFALLRSREGRIATLHASWTEWERYRFRLELVGARGMIRLSCFPMRTEVVWAEETGGRARRRVHRFPATFLGEHLRSYRWVVARSFAEELAAFEAAAAGRPSAMATGLDGLRAVEIAAAAARPGEAEDDAGTRVRVFETAGTDVPAAG